MRYDVRYVETFGCADTKVYSVTGYGAVAGPLSAEKINVWVNGKRIQCVSCSGPLQAMLSTCAHANAVRRHLKRESL